MSQPWAAVAAPDGSVYISDSNYDRIRKVAPNGVISTVAGLGSAGFDGDNGRASEAFLYFPTGLAVDSAGNLYIADTNNNKVRMIDTAGVIHTIAGNGTAGFSGEGAAAATASLNHPYGVAVDSQGRILIADTGNHRIRMVDPTTHAIVTIAGTGTAGSGGDGGPASKAQLNTPRNLAVDSKGTVYIADELNVKIRRITPDQTISTFAGTGVQGYSGDAGPATSARLANPRAVLVDEVQQQVYIADTYNMGFRRVDLASGNISTFAGSAHEGTSGDGGPANKAQFDYPSGVGMTADRRILLVDTFSSRIRVVGADGNVSPFAGRGNYGGDSGPAISALLNSPGQMSWDANGNMLVADTYNYCIRRITPAGVIATVAGTCLVWGSPVEGSTATQTFLNSPAGVVADKAGNLYLSDTNNNKIRKVDTIGKISTFAPGVSLVQPTFLILDAAQANLYVSESGASRVTKINLAASTATVVAGTGTAGFAGDGGQAASAKLNGPQGLVFDASGNLYIADTGNNLVRWIDSTGVIRTYAGDGSRSYLEGPAKSVGVPSPVGLAMDAAGNLFIGHANWYLTRVDAKLGTLAYLVGTPGYYTTFLGDGTLAIAANVPVPGPVAIDGTGNLYLADRYTNRIRLLKPVAPAQMQVSSGNGQTGFAGAVLPAAFAVQVTGPNGLLLPDIAVQFTVTSGDATLSAASVMTDFSGYAGVTITLGKQVGPITLQAASPGLTPVTITGTLAASTPVPVISNGGVVALSSSANSIQPGEWISIFGANLAAAPATWNGDFPTTLGGVTVTINNKPAYLWFVSSTQLNVQAPDDSTRGRVTVTVTNSYGTAVSSVVLSPASPSFSLLGDGKHAAGVIVTADGSGAYGGGTYDLLGPKGAFGFATRPVKAGETLILYGVGFGPTSPAVAAGSAYSGAASTVTPVQITIGGVQAPVAFAGITSAGLYQFNITVPAVSSGDKALQATVNGFQTQPGPLVTVQ
jgi:uncharacterized protein (TIGR03437 family)